MDKIYRGPHGRFDDDDDDDDVIVDVVTRTMALHLGKRLPKRTEKERPG